VLDDAQAPGTSFDAMLTLGPQGMPEDVSSHSEAGPETPETPVIPASSAILATRLSYGSTETITLMPRPTSSS
jgi:hypothetical protein